MKKEKKKSFADYLNEIEEIVENLESGEIDIDKAIEEYEKAMDLIEKCKKILNESKLKIEVLKKKTEKGWETEPLNIEEEEKEEKEEEKEEKEEKEIEDENEFKF